MPKLIDIFLLPPAALARLGGSTRPLDNHEWRSDPSIHGAAQTVIEPVTTLDVAEDGSVAAFQPATIRFRDGKELRPVAPFFEIWAKIQSVPGDPPEDGEGVREVPLTATLLRALGGSATGVTYVVHAANRKAARRSGDAANAFEATVRVRGDDHRRTPLLAITTPRPGQEPLVTPEHPIPLGTFQVVRPIRRLQLDVDLDVLRVRFTPARGQVYGPPSAVEAQGNTSDRFFEIVPPENRTLNPRATWLAYDGSYATFTNPEPWDTYDGADQDANRSWGIVDDTCDGTLSASVTVGSRRFQASARFFVGPPDYSPDRRPFASLADDLADRDTDPTPALDSAEALETAKASIADLFARVFETASMLNLDALRSRAIGDNETAPQIDGLPRTDDESMLATDVGYASDRIKSLAPNPSNPQGKMQFTPLVQLAHSPLATEDGLLAFLTEHAERARVMLRPAYGSFDMLPPSIAADAIPNPGHRDPRIDRDRQHDMRMPPYMRDESARALSLSRRQYVEVIALIDALSERTASKPNPLVGAADTLTEPEQSNLRKRVRAVLARIKTTRAPGAS